MGLMNFLFFVILTTAANAELYYGNDYASANNSSRYKDCPYDLLTLERALYETTGNKLNLTNTFYPSRKTSTAFVKVIYRFMDEEGGFPDDCSVKFVWTTGGFLLVQSPSIFRFTSLFFGNEVDDLNELYLSLPFECRPLVQYEGNGSCSCMGKENDAMDVLTQQVQKGVC